MKDSYTTIFNTKQRILVVMAHPDDAEIMAGGTIARLTSDNKEVRVVKVTGGEKGSREHLVEEFDLVHNRAQENADAMRALGVPEKSDVFLGFRDGEIEYSLQLIEAIARQVREFKPELVITHNPEDKIITYSSEDHWVNHRDHLNIAQATIDAVYPYSRDTLFFPHHFDEGLTSHVATEFLFTDYFNHPESIYIDINETINTKRKAVQSHASQFDAQRAAELANFMSLEDHGEGYFETFRYVQID